MTTKEAVSAGIALLDARAPKDWRSRITRPLTSEDMEGLDTCVLARVFRCQVGEAPIRESLGLDWHMYEKGFNPPEMGDFPGLAAEWNRQLGIGSPRCE